MPNLLNLQIYTVFFRRQLVIVSKKSKNPCLSWKNKCFYIKKVPGLPEKTRQIFIYFLSIP